MRFAFAVVPQAQFRTRARPARTGDDHSEEVAKKLSSGIHAQFAARRDDRFTQDLESPKIFQCEAEINFFADKVLLIETAGRLEIASRGERKCAGPKVQTEVNRRKPA